MQIEDGGDNPQVNNLLLAALKAGLRHQIGEQQARPIRYTVSEVACRELPRSA